MNRERRKFKRFKAKLGAFAVFVKADEIIKMGKILNITMGGLCLEYLAINKAIKGCSRIKIFGSNDRFIRLETIQCRIAYDIGVPEDSSQQIIIRRCGIKFRGLDLEQQRKLKEFIKHFTIDEAHRKSGILPAV